MQEFIKHIEAQLAYNAGKNLFSDKATDTFSFISSTYMLLLAHPLSDMDALTEERLIDLTIEKTLDSFYQINQYYSFSMQALSEVKQIYRKLFHELKVVAEQQDESRLNLIAERHYLDLQHWLRRTNPFAKEIYPAKNPVIDKPVVCAAYTPETQLRVLGISLWNIVEPILDIGCGKEGWLVAFLRQSGFEAYGIDRNLTPAPFLTKADWLDYTFEPGNWGTLISNLGFSNHFMHHHTRTDGDYIGYAKKYMEILHALKPGGAFYYAPGLPFIESYLDVQKFALKRISVANTNYQSVRIRRIH